MANRRSWFGLRRPELALVHSPRYLLDVPGVLHDALRAERILTFLLGERLLRPQQVLAPQPAPIAALRRVHDDDYLEGLHRPGGLIPIIGFDVDDELQARILEMLRWMTGGTMLAVARALERGGVAVNLGGGFHHAHRASGGGFCAYNDVAIAIAAERARGFAGRVLVVDLDLHDGDGTRAIFAADPTVHTFSMHNWDWVEAPALESTAVAFGSAIEDGPYLALLEEHLPPLFERFRPELVILLAGADAAAGDRLGDGELSPDGLLERDLRVLALARGQEPQPVPLAMLLAGGYGNDAWRYAARTLAWLASGQRREPPPTAEIAVERYRLMALMRSMGSTPASSDSAAATAGGEDWGLTAEDLSGLEGPPRETRLLGYYTEAGLELALERAGLIERLRKLGYPRPALELDLENPQGQTVRLFGDAARTELLVEARMRRDRTAVEGLELLNVEWLLLQNPRARFTAERPPLPGQSHPGLGLAEDVAALLVLACERLHLDGLLFVPSHAHLILPGPERIRFLDPSAEARWRRFKQLAHNLPLVEVAARLERGELRDPETGAVARWQPAAVVYPVSPALRELVESDDYERRVAAAMAASADRGRTGA